MKPFLYFLFLLSACQTTPKKESLYIPWNPLPTREELLTKSYDVYDLIVIGGGATGAGIALDASSRGLKVALVERGDFGSQTSSKSTKLVHGGVRYLEKAIKQRDRQQYQLVKEALHERGTLIHIAPYMVHPLKIITPTYQLSTLPMFWTGLKLYDLISGSASLGKSHYLSPSKVKEELPHIKTAGLKGGIAYYDAQFNDTRLNITLILSAMQLGAHAFNYMEVTDLIKEEGEVVGVEVIDLLGKLPYTLYATKVINATGPFSDTIRKLDNPNVVNRITPSAGTHILLEKAYVGGESGMLIPKTEDGRVMFLLPWQNHTIAGTTDHKAELTQSPRHSEAELEYLLNTLSHYVDTPVTKQDVKAVWTGLRPLVRDPHQDDPSKLCRTHQLEVAPSGLISIMGGKWTTYRLMSEECVNLAFPDAPPSPTNRLKLIGSLGYTPHIARVLHEETDLDLDICEHLVDAYGMLAFDVVHSGSAKRLIPHHPIIEAEVTWAMEHEFAHSILDVLCRRTRLAFLDTKAAIDVTPRVAKIMGREKEVKKTKATLLKESGDILKRQKH